MLSALFSLLSVDSTTTPLRIFVLMGCWVPVLGFCGDPIAEVSFSNPSSIVDSHPYSIVIDDLHQFGYASICGDVAPMGEPVEDHSGHQVVEFDARSLKVLRTFDVGYYPTDMLISGSDLWVSCSTVSSLFRVDLVSGEVSSVPFTDSSGSDIGYPSGLALGWNGEIIVSSNGGNFDGSDENIVILNPLTEEVIQHIEVAGGISTMAALEDGSLLVPVGFPGNDFTAAPLLQWINPIDGQLLDQLIIDVETSDFPAPSDLEILDDQSALLTIFGGSAVVYRIDLINRTLMMEYPMDSVDPVQSAVVQGDSDTFLVAEYFAGTVSRYQLDSGELVETLTGGDLPNRICVSGGRIFTTQQGVESITVHGGVGAFVRADLNLDGQVDLADPIRLLNYLFLGTSLDCLDSADSNDDGALDLSDVIHILSFLFSQGPSPLYPFPVAGGDLSDDNLDCETTG
ncbi:MAG: hypothetical protein OSB09_00950 [Planctomycetota bacterium]|nr:hypothetical protein [Planctomycetota bacterium]